MIILGLKTTLIALIVISLLLGLYWVCERRFPGSVALTAMKVFGFITAMSYFQTHKHGHTNEL